MFVETSFVNSSGSGTQQLHRSARQRKNPLKTWSTTIEPLPKIPLLPASVSWQAQGPRFLPVERQGKYVVNVFEMRENMAGMALVLRLCCLQRFA